MKRKLGSNNKISIPCAETKDKKLVYATVAKKSTEAPYACIECNNVLILKQGKILTPHFSHKGNSSIERTCSGGIKGESKEHLEAKTILCELNQACEFISKCQTCMVSNLTTYQIDMLKNHYAVEEYKYDKYRIDVCIKDKKDDSIVLFVEVKHKHAVPLEKSNFLSSQVFPWIEVEAQDILDCKEPNTDNHNIIQIPYISKVDCDKCISIVQEKKLKDEQLKTASVNKDYIDDEVKNWLKIIKGCYPQPRLYLNVTYAEKEAAKKCGAKWCREKNKWYAQNINDMISCSGWIPDENIRLKFENLVNKLPDVQCMKAQDEFNPISSDVLKKHGKFRYFANELFDFSEIETISEDVAWYINWIIPKDCCLNCCDVTSEVLYNGHFKYNQMREICRCDEDCQCHIYDYDHVPMCFGCGNHSYGCNFIVQGRHFSCHGSGKMDYNGLESYHPECQNTIFTSGPCPSLSELKEFRKIENGMTFQNLKDWNDKCEKEEKVEVELRKKRKESAKMQLIDKYKNSIESYDEKCDKCIVRDPKDENDAKSIVNDMVSASRGMHGPTLQFCLETYDKLIAPYFHDSDGNYLSSIISFAY